MQLVIHANVFAEPSLTVAGPEAVLRGLRLPTLQGESGGPPTFDRTLPVNFEAVQEQLTRIERIDCEPDGFFLYTGGSGESFWRINGHMHEYEGQVHRVELNGDCPEDALDAVLKTLGWPDQTLTFELVQEGLTLAENAFRAWAVEFG